MDKNKLEKALCEHGNMTITWLNENVAYFSDSLMEENCGFVRIVDDELWFYDKDLNATNSFESLCDYKHFEEEDELVLIRDVKIERFLEARTILRAHDVVFSYGETLDVAGRRKDIYDAFKAFMPEEAAEELAYGSRDD